MEYEDSSSMIDKLYLIPGRCRFAPREITPIEFLQSSVEEMGFPALECLFPASYTFCKSAAVARQLNFSFDSLLLFFFFLIGEILSS